MKIPKTKIQPIPMLYFLILLIAVIVSYGRLKISALNPTFIGLCALPLIRNGLFLVRSHQRKDWLTFHMSIMGGVVFLLIAICAR